MSQFRKTGGFYVSEWGGNDANAGTDPLAPKASISSLPNSSTVGNLAIIGSGTYLGGWGATQKRIVADGKVIINGQGSATFGANSNYITGIYFKNFLNAGANFNNYVNDCIFENCTTVGLSFSEYRNMVLTDSFINFFGNNGRLRNGIFIGKQTNTLYFTIIEYSFIAKLSRICLFVNTNQINNCINGEIVIAGVTYESKRLIDGSTRPDADPLIPDVIDAFPDFYTQGNFAGDPKFIDVISRTVEPDSDLLKKSNANGFIGGVKAGQYINFQNSDFVITTQNIDTSNPDLLRIADGFDFGKIRITGKVSDTLISSQLVDIRIPFFFDSSEPGGDPLNNNVPDSVHGLRGLDTLGDLPYRLRFEVRSSQMPNASRFNNDEWDNDISGIAGRWYLMEYGQPMLHHIVASVAYGNADKDAINAPVKVPFNYRSLDIEITLSNDRSQV